MKNSFDILKQMRNKDLDNDTSNDENSLDNIKSQDKKNNKFTLPTIEIELNLTKLLAGIFIFLLILFFFCWEVYRESYIYKVPYSPIKTLKKNMPYEVEVSGSYNTAYPNAVYITCSNKTKTCEEIVSSILFDTLDINKNYYKILYWDNELIKSYRITSMYNIELIFNLKNNDLIYNKYPIIDKDHFTGEKPEIAQFKLIDGIEQRELVQNYELNFWKAPIAFFFKRNLKKDGQ